MGEVVKRSGVDYGKLNRAHLLKTFRSQMEILSGVGLDGLGQRRQTCGTCAAVLVSL